jgi:hypothetical protein
VVSPVEEAASAGTTVILVDLLRLLLVKLFLMVRLGVFGPGEETHFDTCFVVSSFESSVENLTLYSA